MGKKIEAIRNADPFRIVAGTLLAATFVVVPAELGPVIADGLNMTGRWAALGYALAVVFDLVWLAALGKVPAAVRQSDRIALGAALGTALVGVAASVSGVVAFGSMPALATVPVAALAVHVLGLVTTGRLADASTDAAVRASQIADRSRKVQSDQGARSLAVTRSLAAAAQVATLTAQQDDDDALEAALTKALAAREVRRTTQAAQLESKLSAVTSKHGEAAAAFQARGLLPAAPVATELPPVPAAPVQPSDGSSADFMSGLSESDAGAMASAHADDSYDFIAGVLAEAEDNVATDPTMKLLTTSEVAALAGKSEGTVRSWSSRRNAAGHVKLPVADRDESGKSLYRQDDVMKLIG